MRHGGSSSDSRMASGNIESVGAGEYVRAPQAGRPGPIGRMRPRLTPRDLDLLRRLPSNLRKVAEQGYRQRGAFSSQDGMLVSLTAALVHIGATPDEALELLVRLPAGGSLARQRDPRLMFEDIFDRAKKRVQLDRALAIPARLTQVIPGRGRFADGGDPRASFDFEPFDPEDRRAFGPVRRYTVPLVLGQPHAGELAGETYEIADAFGIEPEALVQFAWDLLEHKDVQINLTKKTARLVLELGGLRVMRVLPTEVSS